MQHRCGPQPAAYPAHAHRPKIWSNARSALIQTWALEGHFAKVLSADIQTCLYHRSSFRCLCPETSPVLQSWFSSNQEHPTVDSRLKPGLKLGKWASCKLTGLSRASRSRAHMLCHVGSLGPFPHPDLMKARDVGHSKSAGHTGCCKITSLTCREFARLRQLLIKLRARFHQSTLVSLVLFAYMCLFGSKQTSLGSTLLPASLQCCCVKTILHQLCWFCKNRCANVATSTLTRKAISRGLNLVKSPSDVFIQQVVVYRASHVFECIRHNAGQLLQVTMNQLKSHCVAQQSSERNVKKQLLWPNQDAKATKLQQAARIS